MVYGRRSCGIFNGRIWLSLRLSLSSMIRIGSFLQLFSNTYLYCTSLILIKPRPYLQSNVLAKADITAQKTSPASISTQPNYSTWVSHPKKNSILPLLAPCRSQSRTLRFPRHTSPPPNHVDQRASRTPTRYKSWP